MSIVGFQSMLQQVYDKFVSEKVLLSIDGSTIKAHEVSWYFKMVLSWFYLLLCFQISFPAVTFTASVVMELDSFSFSYYFRFQIQ
jgi:hypothetical protein